MLLHSAAHTSLPTAALQLNPLLNLIVLLPLAGALVLGLGSLFNARQQQGLSEKVVGAIACSGPALATLIALLLFLPMLGDSAAVWQSTLLNWLDTGSFQIKLGLSMDHLSAIMVLMITFIGTLIHLFSLSYMHGDRGFARYFAWLNLFLGAMLLLILSDNIIGLFMGWEGVGLCSYLLIGFWFEDSAKAGAGTKAFLVNRVGDFGFILGIFLLFRETGAFDFATIQAKIGASDFYILPVIAFLLLIGALGKSAQIPLHVWLPDAMAGPTPVSALIHAATMVTAGVYMVARLHFIYTATPAVAWLIVLIGSLTALMAALIALVQHDIKKVLAYSTVSQLGYMFMGVGSGAYAAGMFHVFTHAFFKAALFLGAGAIIHALHHEQDLRKMGGLRKYLPVTHAAMLVSCLAIAGIPPFAGFFSKDEILWSLWEKQHYLFWGVGLVTAALTAFYMFRLYFLAFGGTYRGDHAPQSEPLLMKLPLALLGLGAVSVGFLGMPATLGLPNWFVHWLSPLYGEHPVAAASVQGVSLMLMALSVLAAAAGIGFALKRFGKITDTVPAIPVNAFTQLLDAKFGFDLLYQKGIVKPWLALGQFCRQVAEPIMIDGVIRAGTWAYYVFSLSLRTLQTGHVRTYAQYMLFGLFILVYLYLLLHLPGVFEL
ncbi:NADH-quinone oxidoreductase subunit L [bacterium (Candidatus Blackallbacteria) CG17_big_fil_post_rev_8_21_14_2_50_48_46]|uniref:NADH-quinone oxidoreductase subunit L n=1 Tax=bacterium (Candidatus Blackallbacteria) CG17_big_fil_post_rev_8_21_14_2_50_48_46 TaxID=2014261 RepID=A0A2M7FZ45_9BACT|nr:MAG: NADH-quinone oxidoreductase subunit L [bacterium (Candidatus Blackallbacteria) CG18_big_fil_WC_8_21_14_2_50_49_26]PIW14089.1 MAG: NADH-quinone oxidoreductase subunit L [bacterium (Candidatus Blackallbacteria) CG17_big_fil_post_rev_8_21_14_2_50_48_46]PIW45819.1 MAG: NADH-quinone oxidoreductase subunit L [bacterium (Candidatus Blackallbacteria) CG13_big_fil_rev_8_21_14_2_50_49_14]